ncbi:MAG: lmo0937 family membrane protein [Chloroflexi bacterium]|nr:MAG: lmo0937 family membrane protein [Chloroflexota bacterium]
MLETIIVILLLLWLVGSFGWGGRGRWRGRGRWGGGNLIHILLVIAVILLLIRLLR